MVAEVRVSELMELETEKLIDVPDCLPGLEEIMLNIPEDFIWRDGKVQVPDDEDRVKVPVRVPVGDKEIVIECGP